MPDSPAPATQAVIDALRAAGIDVLAFGWFTPSQLRIDWTDQPRPTTPAVEDAIARAWPEQLDKAKREGRILFDGRMARYIRHEIAGDTLHVLAGPTGYKDFVGTNLFNPRLVEQVPWDCFSNPIGTTATILTADNRLLYGRRNHKVAFHAGYLHTFGGALEPGDTAAAVTLGSGSSTTQDCSRTPFFSSPRDPRPEARDPSSSSPEAPLVAEPLAPNRDFQRPNTISRDAFSPTPEAQPAPYVSNTNSPSHASSLGHLVPASGTQAAPHHQIIVSAVAAPQTPYPGPHTPDPVPQAPCPAVAVPDARCAMPDARLLPETRNPSPVTRLLDGFAGIRRELHEELHLEPADCPEIACVGLVRDRQIWQPEMLFEVRCNLTQEELLARLDLANDEEHSQIESCPDEPAALAAFLARSNLVAPVAVASMLLHGWHRWGPVWTISAAHQAR